MLGRDLVKVLPKDSWLREYMDIWPLAEPPKSYILFSAIAMLGSALGRRMWFDLDVHKVYPLFNLLLIGPSGIGKSTSLRDMALENLLRPLPNDLRPQIITGKSTKEALHDDLMADPHAIIVASELSNFFSKEKYQEGTIQYITDLLDLAPTSVRTKSGGVARVINEPAVSIVGGSTREWLQEQLPTTAGAGGFLPRFLMIKEDHKGQRVADPGRSMGRNQKIELAQRRSAVCNSFRHLIESYRGPMDFEDYEASDAYSYWYNTQTPEVGILSPFSARAGVHVMRLALLLAVSCGGTSITKEHVRSAITLWDYSMSKLTEVVVPMTPAGKMLAKVMEIVGDDVLSDMQIRRAMRNYCGSDDVDRFIRNLVASGDLKIYEGKYRKTGK